MKRFYALVITAIFILGLAVSPVFAGGGKVQGDNSVQGDEQGIYGNGSSPGDNAQGRQA